MALSKTQILQKLNKYKTNPEVFSELTPNELASLVLHVMGAVKAIDESIKSGQLDISSQLKKEIAAAVKEGNSTYSQVVSNLEQIAAEYQKTAETTNKKLSDDVKSAIELLNTKVAEVKDGEVTDNEIQRAAEIASALIDLPDFDEMVDTAIKSSGESIVDAINLLPDGDGVEMSKVKGLVPLFDQVKTQIARIPTGQGGTIGKGQVYSFIRQAIADGTISTGGGSVSDEAYDASWNGVTDEAPSKNAIYDKIETLPGGHDPVTVTDSAEIDFTLTDQDITAELKAGSIDETKLDTSVNDSLDLADSALQNVVEDTTPQLGGDLDAQGNDITAVGVTTFDTAYTPTGSEPAGSLYWNETDFTLDLVQNGAVLQVGQEMNKKVRNATGGTLTEGTVVYENGQLGNRATIAPAQSDTEATAKITGVLTEDILNNTDGKVTTIGLVRQIKTDYTGTGVWGTTWAQGDLLYASKTTAGQLTNVEPAIPHHADIVGKVSIVGAAGIGAIDVQIQHHFTLSELSDVNGTPLATTGQIPVWDNTAGYFDFTSNISDFATAAQGALADSAVQDLSDLSITATSTELNYTDGVTSNIQTQLDAKASLTGTETLTNKTLTDPKIVGSINAQTGTTYTLVLADASKTVTMSNASANTLTVPPNASVAFPTGTRIFATQLGAGATTIAAGAGVTINAPTTVTLAIDEQHESRGLLKTGSDVWTLV